MRSSLTLLGAASLFALSGCGLPSSQDVPDAEAASATTTALVVVERSAGPGDATRGDAVIARFVRVSQGAVDDRALRIAGAALDLPPVGTCAVALDAQGSLAGRSIELVDVGTVSLESAQGKTPLLARAMPDPAGVVSGLFYSTRAADVFASGRVQLRATGSADLADGFAVTLPAPRDVGDVRVSSIPAGLDLAWDATDADPRDLVYVDVSTSSSLVTRCTSSDAGHFVVPAGNLAAVDEGQVSVHRVHRETFRTRAIDPGEVRFDVARVVAFRR